VPLPPAFGDSAAAGAAGLASAVAEPVARAANFSPRAPALSGLSPTGVAVTSYGGLKLGAKGLDAP
jgi:hypothetical protein